MSDDTPRSEKRPYVRRDQARILLIDAALGLLRTKPFPQVTTKEIAAAAGLTPMAIQTTFGGQKGLYQAVSNTLLERVLSNFSAVRELSADGVLDIVEPGDPPGINMLAFLDPDLVLRSKLVAWLLGEGVDPAAFEPDTAIREAMVTHLKASGASEEVAGAFASMVGFLLSGFSVFSPSRPIPPEEFITIVGLFQHLRDQLPALSADREPPGDSAL